MTRQEADAVLDRVPRWPEDRQAYAALVLVQLEREYEQPYQLSADEEAAIDEALREEAAGRFASDAEVEADFARCRGQ